MFEIRNLDMDKLPGLSFLRDFGSMHVQLEVVALQLSVGQDLGLDLFHGKSADGFEGIDQKLGGFADFVWRAAFLIDGGTDTDACTDLHERGNVVGIDTADGDNRFGNDCLQILYVSRSHDSRREELQIVGSCFHGGEGLRRREEAWNGNHTELDGFVDDIWIRIRRNDELPARGMDVADVRNGQNRSCADHHAALGMINGFCDAVQRGDWRVERDFKQLDAAVADGICDVVDFLRFDSPENRDAGALLHEFLEVHGK